jgi:type III pantothenate kinase
VKPNLTEASFTLVIDAGNTRIKWALHDGARFVQEGWRERNAIDALGRDWQDLPAPAAVAIASVAGETVARALSALCARWPLQPLWVAGVARQCGVANGYADPAQLGADRWSAMVAAHALHPGACLVICMGTATTIDALTASGEFLGGVIVPGIDLMHEALAAKAARLGAERGAFSVFPRATRDAITSGAIQATCGAVERMRRGMIEAGAADPQILACGGSASLLAGHLGRPVQVHDKLILEGLVRISEASR